MAWYRTWILISAMLLIASQVHSETLTISAAASLTEAFKDVVAAFEQAHPDTRVKLNLAASGILLQQIRRGAPVDILACADLQTMETAAAQGLLVPGTQRNFARNSLVLVTPARAHSQVDSLRDLAGDAVKYVALGNPEYVPAGRLGRAVLEREALWPQVAAKIIHANNVRQVLSYVVRAEVDAGLVYATDAQLMKDKLNVVTNLSLNGSIVYPIAIVQGSSNTRQAKRFIDFVQSPAGRDILIAHGFKAVH